jgi:predicted MFS family arabinose efflux permease
MVRSRSGTGEGQLRQSSDIHATPVARPPAGAWLAVGTITFITIVSFIDRQAFIILAPAMKRDLGLLDTQLGILMGAAFSFTYALSAFPIARWADRGNRRNILVICLMVWSAMTMLTSLAQQFWHLLVTRMGVAAAEGGGPPVSQSMICDFMPLRYRAPAFSVFGLGSIIGASIGAFAAGMLAETIGWRMTFLVLGAPGLAAGLVMRLALREPARGQFDIIDETSDVAPFLVQLKTLWARTTFRRSMYYMFLTQVIFVGMAAWWPSVFERVHGLSLSMVGIYTILALIGPALGFVAGAAVAHRLADSGVRAPILISAVGAIFLLPVLVGTVLSTSSLVAVALLSVGGFMATFPNGAVMATYQSVLDPRARATGAAIMGLFAALGGGVGPVVIGVISDTFGQMGSGPALRVAMLVPAAATPLLAILLFGIARSLARDLEPKS